MYATVGCDSQTSPSNSFWGGNLHALLVPKSGEERKWPPHHCSGANPIKNPGFYQ